MTYLSALTEELRQHGVERWTVDASHKHPRLCFEWRGRQTFFVFASSPSDGWRGEENALSELRKKLGVKRIVVKSTAPKRRKARAQVRAVMPALPSFAGRADPFAPLADLRRRMGMAE